jgi:hypothetical protein
LAQGHLRNVLFSDLEKLIRNFGFILARQSGSHHIFSHPDIPELINLQEVRGEAKPHQFASFFGWWKNIILS